MRMRVAIIDDDESICRSLVRLVGLAGLRPTAFPSAEVFLASPLRGEFGCLVLDVQLHGMSGLELRQHLLDGGDLTPVIFLTAHDDPTSQSEAARMGCVSFLRKGRHMLSLVNILLGVERGP